jgi:hypothetical protein
MAPPDSSSIISSSTGCEVTGWRSRQLFVARLCSHVALLIQVSNNTIDAATAFHPSSSSSSSPQPLSNPSHASHTEPWHPDDLADAVAGLAAAAGARSQNGSGSRSQKKPGHRGQSALSKSSSAKGFKGQAAAELLDAAAHEVYRQLSNRHSTAGSFTVEGVVSLLQAYCDLGYKDGE